jgi:hypothetical protein
MTAKQTAMRDMRKEGLDTRVFQLDKYYRDIRKSNSKNKKS